MVEGVSGAGVCERCGTVGEVRKVQGLIFLCSLCRQIYDSEKAHQTEPEVIEQKEYQQNRIKNSFLKTKQK